MLDKATCSCCYRAYPVSEIEFILYQQGGLLRSRLVCRACLATEHINGKMGTLEECRDLMSIGQYWRFWIDRCNLYVFDHPDGREGRYHIPFTKEAEEKIESYDKCMNCGQRKKSVQLRFFETPNQIGCRELCDECSHAHIGQHLGTWDQYIGSNNVPQHGMYGVHKYADSHRCANLVALFKRIFRF